MNIQKCVLDIGLAVVPEDPSPVRLTVPQQRQNRSNRLSVTIAHSCDAVVNRSSIRAETQVRVREG